MGKRRKGSGKQSAANENMSLEEEQRMLDEAVREQLAAFRAKFGRDPLPHEPVFFDPNKDVPTAMEIDDATGDEIREAMTQAGVRPELIYAYDKTGLILSEENRDIYPQEILDEYDAAIEKYFELVKAGKL